MSKRAIIRFKRLEGFQGPPSWICRATTFSRNKCVVLRSSLSNTFHRMWENYGQNKSTKCWTTESESFPTLSLFFIWINTVASLPWVNLLYLVAETTSSTIHNSKRWYQTLFLLEFCVFRINTAKVIGSSRQADLVTLILIVGFSGCISSSIKSFPLWRITTLCQRQSDSFKVGKVNTIINCHSEAVINKQTCKTTQGTATMSNNKGGDGKSVCWFE